MKKNNKTTPVKNPVKKSAKRALKRILPVEEILKQGRPAPEVDLYFKIVAEYKKISKEGVLYSIQINENGKVTKTYKK